MRAMGEEKINFFGICWLGSQQSRICSSEGSPQTDEDWSNNPQIEQMDAD